MNDQTKQKRQPGGVPTGGEFAANEHDEAPSPLGVGGSPKRSFLYPPYLEDAQAVIDYYDDIEIDDATVSKFIDAYGAARAEWARDHMESFDAELKYKYDGDKERIDRLHWEEFRRMETLHPTRVNPIFARDLARVVQMSRISDFNLDDHERAKVDAHKITLANGVDQPIGEIKGRYLVGQYDDDLI